MRWLRRLFDKSRSENHLEKELRFHIEQQIADSIAAGVSLEEARRRANLEFGGLERVKEEVRDTRWETHLDNLLRDFRYALRSLRKDRRFTFIAIFALALGIGATTVMFSVVYNLLFDPFPYKGADRLHFQNNWKPLRCQPIRVSGLTMTKASFQSQRRDQRIGEKRAESFNRLGWTCLSS